MSLGFINGAYNAATGTLAAFSALSDRLVREGFPRMVSRSGDREPADEIAMFTSRFRQQASGSGSFGDVRYWDGRADGYPGGTRWVRFSPEGTVAPPRKSNHGKRRSNDLAYPYNSNTAAARRARQIAPVYGITREGENFGELWHWTFWGALGPIVMPAGGKTGETEDPTEDQSKEDDDMATIISYNDPGDGVRNGIWGAQGGNLLKFTKEQWAQARKRAPWAGAPIVDFKPTGSKDDPTPRAFDVYKSTLTQGGPKTVTADQVERIVTAALKDIGVSGEPVAIDYQKLADAVNDDAAERMAG